MKKISFILMALAMVMGMAQCKKEKINENNAHEGETYHITLTVNSGSNDAKHQVMPNGNVAPVKFETGDEIYVAYNGKHAGVLTCTAFSSTSDQNGNKLGVFSGDIDIAKHGDQPLHFFFLGNKKEHAGLEFVSSGGHATGYVIDITDQTTSLPVISYGKSKQNFPSTDGNYTLEDANGNWLLNQCALVKFECENIYDMSANTYDNNADAIYTTTKPIIIFGMDNQVSIDLDANTFEWSQKDGTDGAITLYKPSVDEEFVRYAIVAPKTGNENNLGYNIPNGNLKVEFDAANDPYGFFGTYKLVGNVANNAYYQDAKLDLVWHSGAFTISSSGEQIVFSRGNLQYAHLEDDTRPAQTWRFAKHQYDIVGGIEDEEEEKGNVIKDENSHNNILSNNEHIGAVDYEGWIDLFGWGTGNNPTEHSTGDTHYNTWNDWGKNNITNSGKPNNTGWWTTLSHDEWAYLATRNNESKVGLATITTVFGTPIDMPGLVLLPDVFTNPYNWRGLNASGSHSYGDNTYTLAQWKEMEKAGAVFLPAAGYRNGTNWESAVGLSVDLEHGAYYSSTEVWHLETLGYVAYSLRFGTDYHTTDHLYESYTMSRDNGHSVRLVHKLN